MRIHVNEAQTKIVLQLYKGSAESCSLSSELEATAFGTASETLSFLHRIAVRFSRDRLFSAALEASRRGNYQ
jgi:hypothetical protein